MKNILVFLILIFSNISLAQTFVSTTTENKKALLEIYTEELNQFDGTYTKAISLENYPKAIYFLEINTTEGTINKKLVLQ